MRVWRLAILTVTVLSFGALPGCTFNGPLLEHRYAPVGAIAADEGWAWNDSPESRTQEARADQRAAVGSPADAGGANTESDTQEATE